MLLAIVGAGYFAFDATEQTRRAESLRMVIEAQGMLAGSLAGGDTLGLRTAAGRQPAVACGSD